MENIMPELTSEQLNEVVEKKAKEILDMFESALKPHYDLSVEHNSEQTLRQMIKACSLAHVIPFVDPLEKVPHDKLNGAALDRLKMVLEFWNGVKVVLNAYQ
jgi:Na+/H+-translocating membrane pyrophosphatase